MQKLFSIDHILMLQDLQFCLSNERKESLWSNSDP